MTEIDVESHNESVLQFLLSLPQDPEGTGLRVNGKTRFRVVPVSSAPIPDKIEEWSSEANARRCLLIEKDIQGSITTGEAIELEDLQDSLRRHRRLIAPLPLGETRRMLEELEAKAVG
ncbi:hypothetical protein [Zavarzinella formosa]|uniref:hypothetical protein n=1 Tax=Zavarzinella formosa TaxID=360055 RepID=UPI0003127CD9|nr:hypothetical protein [Zavarzinella formosa]